MEPKPWWQSLTIWAQAITLVVLILGVVASQQDLVPETWLKWIVAVQAILNVVLRFITGQPIALAAKK